MEHEVDCVRRAAPVRTLALLSADEPAFLEKLQGAANAALTQLRILADTLLRGPAAAVFVGVVADGDQHGLGRRGTDLLFQRPPDGLYAHCSAASSARRSSIAS